MTNGVAWTSQVWLGRHRNGFLALYASHVLLIAVVVTHCSQFRWTSANWRLLALGAVAVGGALCAF